MHKINNIFFIIQNNYTKQNFYAWHIYLVNKLHNQSNIVHKHLRKKTPKKKKWPYKICFEKCMGNSINSQKLNELIQKLRLGLSRYPLDRTHMLLQIKLTSLAIDDGFLPPKPYFDWSDVGSYPPKFGKISLCLAEILPKMA